MALDRELRPLRFRVLLTSYPDMALGRILNLHRLTVANFSSGHAPFPATQPQGGGIYQDHEIALVFAVTNVCPHGPCTACLPDSLVHDILARYQGLSVLKQMWLARELTASDLFYDVPDEKAFRSKYTYVVEREEGLDLPARRDPVSQTYTTFNVDQRNRFHAAITSVWLLNEVRWYLTNFQYPAPDFVLQIKLLAACKEWINDQTDNPLLDDLDRFAVFRYLYHHLLPLHGRFMADRCDSKLPLTYETDFLKDQPTNTKNFQFFLTAGQVYLQPPDIIDLVVRDKVSRKRPYLHLLIPDSTAHYQCPSPICHFPPSRPPDALSRDTDIHGLNVRDKRLRILGIIARASINQNERHPARHQIVQPDPGALYNLVDQSAAYMERRALRSSGVGEIESLNTSRREWGAVWWRVWWWANSDEKAIAKMEGWRRNKHTSTPSV
jgi:hypothetical protein